jgi:hypothetical protein
MLLVMDDAPYSNVFLIRTMPNVEHLSHKQVRDLLIDRGVMELDSEGFPHLDMRAALEVPEFRSLFETLVGPFLGYW